jgi:hypothetical protein
MSLYHRFNPRQQLPRFGVARVRFHQSFIERDSRTAANFVVPEDSIPASPRQLREQLSSRRHCLVRANRKTAFEQPSREDTKL